MSRGGRGRRFRGGVPPIDKNAPEVELDHDIVEGDIKELVKPTPLFPVSSSNIYSNTTLIALTAADQSTTTHPSYNVGTKCRIMVSTIPRLYA